MAAVGSGMCEDCDLADQSPSLLLLLPVLLSLLWVLFQLFYAPWLLALLVTKLANLFLTDSGIYIGSIHINLLSGRVVFKHLHYYCRDYSIRVSNGYARVNWCGTACACSLKAGKKRSFMLIVLDGFEYHWYNRSEVYDAYGRHKETDGEIALNTEESGFWQWWKETRPSLHFTINKGRILMGNHHLERGLLVQFAKGEAHYSTEQASTQYDELLHSVNFKCSNVAVVLEKSQGYSGPVTEQPPVLCEGMDDAYLLLKTDWANIIFSQDSPGLVPLGETTPPKYAVDVSLGSHSVINYGCYANRQRREIQSFFFPVDHTEQPISHVPQAGERRIHSIFDIYVSLSSAAKFDVLFAHEQSLHRISIEMGTNSQLSIHVPWVTDASGSVSTVKGELLDVCVKSSLPYQPLGSAATIAFQVDLHFPRLWNAVQRWKMNFSGERVQANVMFAYIDFVNALLDDWVGTEPNDLLNFVPVDWTIDIDLAQYEIFLFTNRYNWLDLLEGDSENTRLAFCGSAGHISFGFPFTEYNPPKQLVHFSAKGQDLVVRHYAPPSSTSREGLFALSSANRYRWRVMNAPASTTSDQSVARKEAKDVSTSGSLGSSLPSRPPVSLTSSQSEPVTDDKEQTRLLSTSTTQEHVITAPIIEGIAPDRLGFTIIAQNNERPASRGPLSSTSTLDPAPEKEKEGKTVEGRNMVDKECFPMGCRHTTLYESGWLDLVCGPSISIDINYTSHNHDPSPGEHTPLLPNVMRVDIDAPMVLIRVFGCLARDLLGLKENYPGEYIKMSPFNSHSYSPLKKTRPPTPHLSEAPPPEPYDEAHVPSERTINIYVSFKLRKITAEFPADLAKGTAEDFPLPSLCTDMLSVMVEYVASETVVRLHLDPISVHIPSMTATPSSSPVNHDLGHVCINSVDLNCHGFTEYLCGERVEYAWMMQLLVGRITGAVSSLQLLIALDWFYSTIVHTLSLGDAFEVSPNGEAICPRAEPISEEIKYRLFDLEIAEADVHVYEVGSMARLQSAGLDLQMCTFHDGDDTLGLSWQLQSLTVTGLLPDPQEPSLTLQVGLLDLNILQGNLALREPLDSVASRQLSFLRRADLRTRRLWFLWKEESLPVPCGCCGGCLFMKNCVTRKTPVVRSESAVYAPQFSPLTSVPRHMGFGKLGETLLQSNISELECMWSLHKGLQDHYQVRYADKRSAHQAPLTLRPEERSSKVISSRPVSGSDDASFVSARSSLTSLLAEDYVSVKDVHVEAVEELLTHRTTNRHKRKPSGLSMDVRSGDQNQVDCEDSCSGYSGIVNSCFLHSATFQIPCSAPTGDHAPSTEQTRFKVHHRHSVSDTSYVVPQSADTAPLPSAHFLVYVPCLSPDTAGALPLPTQTAATYTLERKRRTHFLQTRPDGKQDAKFSLSVQLSERNQLILSPPFLKIITEENLPGHFKFKEYCPRVFHNLRKRFGMDDMEYMNSLIIKPPQPIHSPGRSGSKFFLSYDKRVIIKSITSEEVALLHQILQPYHEHLVTSDNTTLLPQYLGCYRFTVNGAESYWLLMRSVFSSRVCMHRQFDLKGSTVDRQASDKEKAKSNPTLKDLDFTESGEKIAVGTEAKDRIMKVLEKDVQLLQKLNLMDYSLLVGIHDCTIPPAPDEEYTDSYGEDEGNGYVSGDEIIDTPASPTTEEEMPFPGDGPERTGTVSPEAVADPQSEQHGVDIHNTPASPGTSDTEHNLQSAATCTGDTEDERPSQAAAMVADLPGERIECSPALVRGEKEVELAVAEGKYPVIDILTDVFALASASDAKPQIYFVGLIDVLTNYGARKRAAHAAKTMKHGAGAEISTVKPDQYARRFLDFISKCIV